MSSEPWYDWYIAKLVGLLAKIGLTGVILGYVRDFLPESLPLAFLIVFVPVDLFVEAIKDDEGGIPARRAKLFEYESNFHKLEAEQESRAEGF